MSQVAVEWILGRRESCITEFAPVGRGVCRVCMHAIMCYICVLADGFGLTLTAAHECHIHNTRQIMKRRGPPRMRVAWHACTVWDFSSFYLYLHTFWCVVWGTTMCSIIILRMIIHTITHTLKHTCWAQAKAEWAQSKKTAPAPRGAASTWPVDYGACILRLLILHTSWARLVFFIGHQEGLG